MNVIKLFWQFNLGEKVRQILWKQKTGKSKLSRPRKFIKKVHTARLIFTYPLDGASAAP